MIGIVSRQNHSRAVSLPATTISFAIFDGSWNTLIERWNFTLSRTSISFLFIWVDCWIKVGNTSIKIVAMAPRETRCLPYWLAKYELRGHNLRNSRSSKSDEREALYCHLVRGWSDQSGQCQQLICYAGTTL